MSPRTSKSVDKNTFPILEGSLQTGKGSMTNAVATIARDSILQQAMPRVVVLELILTEACNLGCSYCFEYQADFKQSMNSRVMKEAIDFLMQASRSSRWVSVSFMGGEPLLQFDLIERTVRYSRTSAVRFRKSISFDLQTNGVLIRENHAKFFRDQGVRYCLSLDGARLTHDRHRKTLGGSGTFQIVAAKMRMLKRYQHWQGARMTVMPEDAVRLGENIRDLHEELAINQFVIGFATHVEWTDRQIADYAAGLKDAFDYFVEQRVFKKSRRIRIGLFEIGQLTDAYQERGRSAWGCGAGSGRLAISPDGTFHGCSKLAWGTTGGSANAPLPLGSVDTGFSKPENRLKLLDHSETPRIKCHSCEIAAHCNGGCHAASFADTGNMYVPADYFCKLMFAQKEASDYARGRLKELGIDNLYWNTNVPDLTNPRESAERIYDDAD